jgi:hypothetical protein
MPTGLATLLRALEQEQQEESAQQQQHVPLQQQLQQHANSPLGALVALPFGTLTVDSLAGMLPVQVQPSQQPPQEQEQAAAVETARADASMDTGGDAEARSRAGSVSPDSSSGGSGDHACAGATDAATGPPPPAGALAALDLRRDVSETSAVGNNTPAGSGEGSGVGGVGDHSQDTASRAAPAMQSCAV